MEKNPPTYTIPQLRNQLLTYQGKTLYKSDVLFDSLVSLLTYHPTWGKRLSEIQGIQMTTKRGKLIMKIQIVKSLDLKTLPPHQNSPSTISTRFTPRKTSPWFMISWRKAAGNIRFKKKPTLNNEAQNSEQEYKNHFQQALRQSIKYQIQRFRKTFPRPLNCSCCQRLCTSINDWHVDHIIPFSGLSQEFLTTIPREKWPKTFRFHRSTCRRSFCDQDKSFKKKWQSFHQKKAQLQWLCKYCNQGKGNRMFQEKIDEEKNFAQQTITHPLLFSDH